MASCKVTGFATQRGRYFLRGLAMTHPARAVSRRLDFLLPLNLDQLVKVVAGLLQVLNAVLFLVAADVLMTLPSR